MFPGMAEEPHVRRATSADVPALARMLMRAFLDDPVARWACPPDALRPASLERFQANRLRQLLVHDEVWTTDELSCAALWAPPARWRTTLREDAALVRIFNHPRLLARMPLVTAGWLALERKHPVEPLHWYLAALGGLAGRLHPRKKSLLVFSARLGVGVGGEVKRPRAPKMWKMLREPRS